MTQVQTMTNPELNRALAELMGYRVVQSHTSEEGGGAPYYQLVGPDFRGRFNRDPENAWNSVTDYCTDPAASLEVQTAAIRENARLYAINLAKRLKWDEDGDPLSFSDDDLFSYTGVANFFTASPRERAEAAYITLQTSKG